MSSYSSEEEGEAWLISYDDCEGSLVGIVAPEFGIRGEKMGRVNGDSEDHAWFVIENIGRLARSDRCQVGWNHLAFICHPLPRILLPPLANTYEEIEGRKQSECLHHPSKCKHKRWIPRKGYFHDGFRKSL